MEHSDAVFLVEIEEFLASCDLPTLLSSPARNEAESRLSLTGSDGDEVNAQESDKNQTEENKLGKSYYKRRKMVHKCLQHQVTELTEKLDATVQANARRPSIWMTLANYQHQLRIRAESRNRKLRAAVYTRSRLIQDFRRLLTVRQHGLENLNSETHLVEESCQYKSLAFEQADIEILAQYMSELDTVYVQTDEALCAGGLDLVGEDWRGSGQTWKEDGSGCFLYVHKQGIPYNFQQTCTNLWRVENLPDWRGSHELFAGVSDRENTMAVRFRAGMCLHSDLKAHVLQRVVVVRRYKEHDRMVIVWRSFAKGEGLYAGMHADETGWSVVTPLKGTSEPESMLKMCIRHTPMHLHGVQPVARQFTNVVLDTRTNEASKFLLALEKLLREA